MLDDRLKLLASQLVRYSCNIQKGEKLLIEASNKVDEHFLAEIVKETYLAGGMPFVNISSSIVGRAMAMHTTEEREKAKCKYDYPQMEDMDAYISIGAGSSYESSDVPKAMHDLILKHYIEPVHFDSRVRRTKWVILLYPTQLAAQQAKMSTEAFEDFYLDVCTLDYAKMDKAMDPLAELMKKTDKVRIVAPGTDLTFSIKGIGAVKCSGRCNIPDGEVFTAPVRNSVNGVIQYNTDSPYDGKIYKNIRLEFKDGKIVNASCENGDNESLNKIFDSDEGSRYIGEFALGLNPLINEPVGSILFDEKIWGSFHFTPGQCYKGEAENGNDSIIHWDLVCIQTGGGEIYFDDVLIRKDGQFVLKELEFLNYGK